VNCEVAPLAGWMVTHGTSGLVAVQCTASPRRVHTDTCCGGGATAAPASPPDTPAPPLPPGRTCRSAGRLEVPDRLVARRGRLSYNAGCESNQPSMRNGPREVARGQVVRVDPDLRAHDPTTEIVPLDMDSPPDARLSRLIRRIKVRAPLESDIIGWSPLQLEKGVLRPDVLSKPSRPPPSTIERDSSCQITCRTAIVPDRGFAPPC
jgi:hypothetical protein